MLDLLKRTKREGRGSPPKTYLDRDEDSIVMGLALSRFEKLKGSREECLYKASRYAAAHDKRPEGKRLTAATIRDRLEHPGKYPPPPSRPCDFFRRG